MKRILFIDAYDSFSNSIVSLLRVSLATEVHLIQIDDSRFVLNDDAFIRYLEQFDAVVVGPGPGHPGNAKDVGVIDRIWRLPTQHLLPVLGICLGFQSLCLAFGGKVKRLNQPRHGRVTHITHNGTDIFTGTGKVFATQYHSLRVDAGHDDQVANAALWLPSKSCTKIVPLAWDLTDEGNGSTLMAGRHKELPFWGVQYHPESICTGDEGRRQIENWWLEACAWNQRQGRVLASNAGLFNALSFHDKTTNPLTTNGTLLPKDKAATVQNLLWRRLELHNMPDVVEIVDSLQSNRTPYPPILLESGRRDGRQVNAETGRFSIIGLHDVSSMHIRYSTSSHTLNVTAKDVSKTFKGPITAMYEHLDFCIQQAAVDGGPEEVPFWGGFIGYISYEAGLEGIGVPSSNDEEDRPDVWFIKIDRSIAVDHSTGALYVQTTRADDEAWLNATENLLVDHAKAAPSIPTLPQKVRSKGHVLSAPVKNEYCSKVRDCQAELRAGCSYELCLTDQTLIGSTVDVWSLYRHLRELNPAPFGACLRFPAIEGCGVSKVQTLDVVSSSPERFLSWSREGKHQFRPIKGTLKKGPGVDRSMAERVLGSPKEQAENLMIVDLIRHDLNGVARRGTVRVPKLMTIEEYETVFQLVSVIEGDLDPPLSGVTALAASLPPGSMTGAPKKRSCELLQHIEGLSSTRGLYSGVIGYLDVGGGGDFSVVIRTAFKWNDEEWRIGAGGAITVLSDEEAEFEEMATKRESLLRAFNVTLREQE